MPRKRATKPPAESAYQRRIRAYQARHPGASRQEARGHKPPAGESEYRRRVRLYKERHPGATGAEARGQAGRSAFLRYLKPGDLVTLAEHVRDVPVDAQGRIGPFEKLVVPADDRRHERRFRFAKLSRAQLARLIEAELKAGAVLTPVPSRDQRQLT